MHTLTIASDRKPGTRYSVALTPAGQAVSCTCPHHQFRGAECKHMRRAELVPAYREASMQLAASGWSKADTHALFNNLKAANRCVEDAILHFIQLAEAAVAA